AERVVSGGDYQEEEAQLQAALQMSMREQSAGRDSLNRASERWAGGSRCPDLVTDGEADGTAFQHMEVENETAGSLLPDMASGSGAEHHDRDLAAALAASRADSGSQPNRGGGVELDLE
ncbi:MAG: hypothetical protein SGPRY_013072, partial [Prymnesium sp.]